MLDWDDEESFIDDTDSIVAPDAAIIDDSPSSDGDSTPFDDEGVPSTGSTNPVDENVSTNCSCHGNAYGYCSITDNGLITLL